MTCVLTPNWNPFGNTFGWPPMDQVNNTVSTPSSGGSTQTLNPPDSEPNPLRTGVSNKKRVAKASHRNISTLSTAQLERKRANDREAQRAIRQRTREHIENLERTNSDLRALHDADRRRIIDLEQENAYFRKRLSELAQRRMYSDIEAPLTDHNLHPIQAVSPAASITRSDPGGMTVSDGPSLRHGAWRPNHAVSDNLAMSPVTGLTVPLNISNWRSHGTESRLTSAPREMGSITSRLARSQPENHIFALSNDQWPASRLFAQQTTSDTDSQTAQDYYSLQMPQAGQRRAQQNYCASPTAPSCASMAPTYQQDYGQGQTASRASEYQPMQTQMTGASHQVFPKMESIGLQGSNSEYPSPSVSAVQTTQLSYCPSPADQTFQSQLGSGFIPYGADGDGSGSSSTRYP